jgi:succinyl-diaminopimelate desuccinylase
MSSYKKLLKKVVSFPSVVQNQTEASKTLSWIEGVLAEIPMKVEWFYSGGYPVLWAKTQKDLNPKIILYAHIDVAPASEEMFKVRRVDGKYIGRGVLDMKFAVACYLSLIHELEEKVSDYNFGLLLTSDEEIGGFDFEKVLKRENIHGEIVLLPDGGFNWTIEEKSKGIVRVRVSAKGNSAHGSRPWEGVSAIEMLTDFLTDLRKEFPTPDPKLNYFQNTLNIGKIEGGEMINQVAERANAELDIRYECDHSNEDNIWRILEIVSAKYPKIDVVQISHSYPSFSDINNPLILDYQRIAEEKFGIKMKSVIAHGSSDARFFTQKGIATFITAPHGARHHSSKEWIDIESLDKFYQVMKEWVLTNTKLN